MINNSNNVWYRRRLARDVIFIAKTLGHYTASIRFNAREHSSADEEPDLWPFQLLTLTSCFSPRGLYYRGRA